MRRKLSLAALCLPVMLAVPPAASAARWSAVATPPRTGLNALSCVTDRWCEAVGGWRQELKAARWDGSRWRIAVAPAAPRGELAALAAVSCRSTRSCVAVGQRSRRGLAPARPLIERWDGVRWRVEAAPSARAPRGYRATNSRLAAVACPGRSLCFAVGQDVPFGAGNAPGAPLIERWDGRRWRLAASPRAGTPLTSISCTSVRACTAVGGFKQSVGRAEAGNLQVRYMSVIERWDGHRWSMQTVSAPVGTGGLALSGVSCASSIACTAVGSAAAPAAAGPSPVDQAAVATWDGTAWSAQALADPAGVVRPPVSQSPATSLDAVYCSATCAAVGGYEATNGALGPQAATYDGITWSQTVLRRGPVELRSIACPALGWCLAVGGGVAERFVG